MSGLVDFDHCDAILSKNPEIRFFVPVHLFGHALDLDRLNSLKDKYELQIVEDCAQAIGAKSRQSVVGSIGQAAATSFYPTKNLGCMGDGGAILTNSEFIANDARTLRDYGQVKKYHHEKLGLNSRLDELQAAILTDAFLPQLMESTRLRKRIAERYISEIKNPNITSVLAPKSSESVWHLFPILVNGSRASFQNHLNSHKIQNGIHYPVLITDQKALKDEYTEDYPAARKFADTEVSIPIHPYLDESMVSRVIQAVNSWGS
jgi:dTDP-3-amino-3,4,6-trideoxy-alpha-D-glucose transaminase